MLTSTSGTVQRKDRIEWDKEINQSTTFIRTTVSVLEFFVSDKRCSIICCPRISLDLVICGRGSSDVQDLGRMLRRLSTVFVLWYPILRPTFGFRLFER